MYSSGGAYQLHKPPGEEFSAKNETTKFDVVGERPATMYKISKSAEQTKRVEKWHRLKFWISSYGTNQWIFQPQFPESPVSDKHPRTFKNEEIKLVFRFHYIKSILKRRKAKS